MVLAVGCGAKGGESLPKPAAGPAPSAAAGREQLVYEQLHSGEYQLEAAADSIQAAYESASKLAERAPKKTDLKTALNDLVDLLDSAGETIAETPDAPESVDKVRKDVPAAEKLLAETLDASRSAKHDLEQAQEIALSILDAANGAAQDTFQELFDLVFAALEDVNGAVEALVGPTQGG